MGLVDETSAERRRRARSLLRREGVAIAAGVHDALSAKLAEAAGFDLLWASGFGISAVRGVPDANILSMTECVDAARHIIGAVRCPVIVDCDTGYGNAVNVMRTVRELEQAGAAGICIEDNVFPKRCSFYPGVRRELVPLEEHALKVAAAKEVQRDPGFVIIARTEALIAGWGRPEALRRARAYAGAGADALLVHSKARDFSELKQFAAEWDGSCPLVAVPTTYPQVTLAELEAAGVKVVIFANQALRAAVRAMRETLEGLRSQGCLLASEDQIVPLQDIYELVGVDDLRAAEDRFLLPAGHPVTAIIIAAGYDPGLMPLVQDRPKAMLDIKGQSILERQIQALNECGVHNIAVVRGYKKGGVRLPNVRHYDNDRYAETSEVASLFAAESEMEGPFVFLYGDIVFDRAMLERLLRSPHDITVVVDRAWRDSVRHRAVPGRALVDLVVSCPATADGDRFVRAGNGGRVVRIGRNVAAEEADGEFVGMAMFSCRGAAVLRDAYRRARERGGAFRDAASLDQATFVDMLQELIDQGQDVASLDVYEGWMEIDTFDDYRRAWAELK